MVLSAHWQLETPEGWAGGGNETGWGGADGNSEERRWEPSRTWGTAAVLLQAYPTAPVGTLGTFPAWAVLVLYLFFYFFKNYLFIYFWLCWVLLLCMAFL